VNHCVLQEMSQTFYTVIECRHIYYKDLIKSSFLNKILLGVYLYVVDVYSVFSMAVCATRGDVGDWSVSYGGGDRDGDRNMLVISSVR
jgi:hypothetical protein